jgi:hypothetical protein
MPAISLLSAIGKNPPYHKPWSVSGPVYSIRARTNFGSMEVGATSKDARPEVTSKDVIGALTNTLPRAPAFSLVSRSYIDETRECTKSPGPQRYSQPNIISNLHHPLYPMPPTKIFAGSERKIHVPAKIPGPGEYDCDGGVILKKSPAYSLRFRELENKSSALRPDSGSYDVLNITRHGKVWKGPSWTLTGRAKDTVEGSSVEHSGEKHNDEIVSLLALSAPKNRLDVSGSKKLKPVPNWSFGKSRRFESSRELYR